MSLIARFFEDKGIPTTSIFLQDQMIQAVPAPRMLHVKWPFGNIYGEVNKPELQAMVMKKAIGLAREADSFRYLEQPDWPWRRTEAELPEDWNRALSA